MPFVKIAQNLFQENIPEIAFRPGTAFSFPVPVRRGEDRLDAVFLYTPGKPGAEAAPRPYAWVLISAHEGKIELFSQCAAVDFIATERYPLEEHVSMVLPKKISDRKYEALSHKLLEYYDLLRPFAFGEGLSREQMHLQETYRDLFTRLAYRGHYPFYYALSPEFFHWLRLPLAPAGDEGKLPDLASARKEQRQLLILENLQQLTVQFQNKVAVDAHKEKLFDQLHQELQEYKNGLLDSLTRSIELDVIKLIDDIRKSLLSFEGKPMDEENYTRMQRLFQGVETDLFDLLYRHGVEPFQLPGEQVEIPRQKVIATVPTGDRALDKRIAQRLAPGWEKEGRIIRPERVCAYIYDSALQAPPGKKKRYGRAKKKEETGMQI